MAGRFFEKNPAMRGNGIHSRRTIVHTDGIRGFPEVDFRIANLRKISYDIRKM
jgi:hypothetical protein